MVNFFAGPTTDHISDIYCISHSFPTNNISTRLNLIQNLILDQIASGGRQQ